MCYSSCNLSVLETFCIWSVILYRSLFSCSRVLVSQATVISRLDAAFCIYNVFPILCFQFALFLFVGTFYIYYSVLKMFSGQGELILLFYWSVKLF